MTMPDRSQVTPLLPGYLALASMLILSSTPAWTQPLSQAAPSEVRAAEDSERTPFLTLDPNGHLIEVQLSMNDGQKLRMIVMDGRMNTISAARPDGSNLGLHFIAKYRADSGELMLHPVWEREIERQGRNLRGLYADEPIRSGQNMPAELRKLGIADLQMRLASAFGPR